MFGFFNKKTDVFEKKKFKFHYHHVGVGDKCEFIAMEYGWISAVNRLLDAERHNQDIYIDYVEQKNIS